MKNLKQIVGAVIFATKKHSPEILITTGIVGSIGATVMACRATLKCNEVIDKYNKNMEAVETALEQSKTTDISYTEKDASKDRSVIAVQAGFDFIKLYGPSVTLGVASIVCILGAFKIMKKRNVALMAAYKLVEETFAKYRSRVKNELGADKDYHFRYGTDVVEEQEIVTDKNTGEKKTVKKEHQKINRMAGSMYARLFETDKPDQFGSWTGSTQWSTVHDYNLSFLTGKEEWFNELLISKGFVTLNEVYDELGFPRTESGMIIGWRYNSNNNNYISFKPENDSSWTYGNNGDSILLDFNVDGVIFDQSKAEKERN